VLIRKQLRGIGRFGYGVSKENFLFWTWTTRPCLTPTPQEYFVAQAEWQQPLPAAAKLRSFNGLEPARANLAASVPILSRSQW
jgi:hypothetical protein